MLDEAHRMNPDGSWWLKMDGCDLVEGLGESVDQQWTGDIDLADGALQEQHRQYLDHLKFVSSCTGSAEIALCQQQFSDDVSFITDSKS